MNILVIGVPGSGKSTLTCELAKRLGLRALHMDQIHWGPHWTVRDGESQRRLIEQAIATDGWVFDGNYLGTMDLRVSRAEMLIWLDLPRRIYLRRVISRLSWAMFA